MDRSIWNGDKVWSYESAKKCRAYLAHHIHMCGKHYKHKDEAMELARRAYVGIWEETFDDREAYRNGLATSEACMYVNADKRAKKKSRKYNWDAFQRDEFQRDWDKFDHPDPNAAPAAAPAMDATTLSNAVAEGVSKAWQAKKNDDAANATDTMMMPPPPSGPPPGLGAPTGFRPTPTFNATGAGVAPAGFHIGSGNGLQTDLIIQDLQARDLLHPVLNLMAADPGLIALNSLAVRAPNAIGMVQIPVERARLIMDILDQADKSIQGFVQSCVESANRARMLQRVIEENRQQLGSALSRR